MDRRVRSTIRVFLVIASAAAFGCTAVRPAQRTNPAAARDAATIRARLAAWVAAANRDDQQATNEIWAPGTVGWFPSAVVFSDSAAHSLAGVARRPGSAYSTFELTIDDLVVDGDVGVVHDLWHETRHFRDSPVTVRRLIRGSELWRRQPDGSWRIARWVSAPEPWTR